MQQRSSAVDDTNAQCALLTQLNADTATATGEISARSQLVHSQQGTIKKLQSQLNFIP
jgi:hypothetical protein